MTDRLMFELTIRTPFRVATGRGGIDIDAAVDIDCPLPASSVKGLMRAAAAEFLGAPADPLLIDVFGAPGSRPSPWKWEDPQLFFTPTEHRPTIAHMVQTRTRIQIDPQTRTTVEKALLVGQELPPTRGQLEIWRRGFIPPDRVAAHRALLILSALLIDGLGAARRAGNGWVTVRPPAADGTGPAVTAADLVRDIRATQPAGHTVHPS